VERGKLGPPSADAPSRLTFTTQLDEALDVDVVIEAIRGEARRQACSSGATPTSGPWRAISVPTSSGFPIEAMVAVVGRADRMTAGIGSSPAPVMRLAEIVRGPATSTRRRDGGAYGDAGKNPVVVKDTTRAWGYVANRAYSAMVRGPGGRRGHRRQRGRRPADGRLPAGRAGRSV
jgi:3-hydroxybutyryl-CoA dehydrogenase